MTKSENRLRVNGKCESHSKEMRNTATVKDREKENHFRKRGHLIPASRFEAPASPQNLRPHHAMRLDFKRQNPLGQQPLHEGLTWLRT